MDSKQRAKLRSQASSLDDIVQIGKHGVTNELIEVVKSAFNNRELIKIKIIETCPVKPNEAAALLAETTKSEIVQIIGSKIVLYKKILRKNLRES